MIVNQLLDSYKKGQKRHSLKDCESFLKENKIDYKFIHKNLKIRSIPTLIPVNHYVRPFFWRKSLLTTIDSAITAALGTVGLSKITTRPTTWVVRNNLASSFPFKLTKLRRAQLAAIFCYDLIGVSKNYPFSNIEVWEDKLKSGFNVAFFPEGSPSKQIKTANGEFSGYLHKLNKKIPNLQILPTSVFYSEKIFFVKFHSPLKINGQPQKLADSVMTKVAKNLPLNLGNNG